MYVFHMLRIPLPFVAALVAAVSLAAQEEHLESRVYTWRESPVASTDHGTVRAVCRGAAHDLAELAINVTTLTPGLMFAGNGPNAAERLFIVKTGKLAATLGAQRRTLGTGSVVLVMPGDDCRLAAVDTPVTVYELRYRSRRPADAERGRRAGGSQLFEWADLPYTANNVGGRRQLFERATAMCSEFEMHVTTLNPGLTTHAPHTHAPEEIVLMIRGEAEMSIDGRLQRGTAGDLFFLGSLVPHNIHNVGTEPAEYYAFQWR